MTATMRVFSMQRSSMVHRILHALIWVGLCVLSHGLDGERSPSSLDFKRRFLTETNSRLFDVIEEMVGGAEVVASMKAGDFVAINNFIDESGLRICERNLGAADEDGDSRLYPDEYALFITFYSNGNIDKKFKDLGVELIGTYFAVACYQCYQATQDDTCCLADKSYVDLDKSDPLYNSTATFLCSVVSDVMDVYMRPTAAPVTDSEEPTLAPGPTISPSVGPTAPPTVSPTSLRPVGTREPSRSPTARPKITKDPTISPTTTVAPVSPVAEPTSSPEPTLTASPEAPAVPTSSPIAEPTGSPPPTITAAPATTVPTSTPRPTLTVAPTVPTLSPTNEPTSTPNPTATQAPATPTSSPTNGPTSTPQPSLTVAPVIPTSTPTNEPTSTPNPTATQAPVTPTSTPTNEPTSTPQPSSTPSPTTTARPTTLAPTMSPTDSPTFGPTQIEGQLLCVTFFYTIQNSAGFTAEDLFNQVNNTVKTGLELATRNITIEILNETFPRTGTAETPTSSNIFDYRNTQHHRLVQSDLSLSSSSSSSSGYTGGVELAMELALADLLGDTEKALAVLDQYTAEFYMVPAAGSLGQHRRRTVQYGLTLDDGSRRLVFYSDAEPPIVTAIIEDPFCPKASTPNIECAIVVTDVCVTLETGDDREQIRTVLVTGLRDAVKSGAFFAAVPPEHIPTVL